MTLVRINCLDAERVGLEHLTLLSRLFLTDGIFLLLCRHRTLNTKQFEELRSYFKDEGFQVYKLKKVYINMFFLEKQEVYNFVNWSNILTGSILALRSTYLTLDSIIKILEMSFFYEKQNWIVPYLFYYNKRFYSLAYIKVILEKVKFLKIGLYCLVFFKVIYIILILFFIFFKYIYLKKVFECLH